MTIPRLIHPVPVTIRQLDSASTLQDDDFREPVQQSTRAATKTLSGQVLWEGDKALEYTKSGVKHKADGYVLFRYKDLGAQSITLRDNDRFTSIGGIATDVYITKLLPMGHYTEQGGPTLVKAFFMDRQPSRQGRGAN